MSKPVVAIIGRPNVGKSTLFNAIAGEPISIVKDTPGVTRDRIYADCTWLNMNFTLIDTGGIEPDSSDIILSQMREQAEIAIETADVIVFITDVRQGLVDSDSKVCDMLRKSRKPVVLAVNKVDSMAKFGNDVYEFYNLGIGDPIPVSAASRLGIGDLLEAVAAHFKHKDTEDGEDDDRPRIAIVGKPNVGKSSLINALVNDNRVIVSPIAGTTRDAIDTPFEWEENKYLLIDTAGIRRKSKVNEDIERYSVIRSIAAIERCDVCLVLIDAEEGLTEQDKKIAGEAHEAGKGIVVVVNKWDLVHKETNTMRDYRRKIESELLFMSYAPVIFISALKKERLGEVMAMVKFVAEKRALRVPTGQLNSLIADAVLMNQPPADKGKRLKVYYATQIGVKPPLFAFSINDRELMHFSYARYLENKIRAAFGFEGTSIKFLFRERGEKK